MRFHTFCKSRDPCMLLKQLICGNDLTRAFISVVRSNPRTMHDGLENNGDNISLTSGHILDSLRQSAAASKTKAWLSVESCSKLAPISSCLSTSAFHSTSNPTRPAALRIRTASLAAKTSFTKLTSTEKSSICKYCALRLACMASKSTSPGILSSIPNKSQCSFASANSPTASISSMTSSCSPSSSPATKTAPSQCPLPQYLLMQDILYNRNTSGKSSSNCRNFTLFQASLYLLSPKSI
mmetsp:Transcript_7885/g.48767  ORF Transcript_7885/g.48767 Transcript_7885/m.48767 type:complete len:239 (+) Transcript_7885:342-1058(+)